MTPTCLNILPNFWGREVDMFTIDYSKTFLAHLLIFCLVVLATACAPMDKKEVTRNTLNQYSSLGNYTAAVCLSDDSPSGC
jgi:hypothetical protein